MTTMTEPTTATIDAPGAVLTYDIRRSDSTTEPALFLLGSPMGAGGFATLASHFPDRTIVTYDPRGVERSVKADPATISTPEQHADDIHRVIAEVGGPVDLFASSGGAVNALALVAKYPERRPDARRARAPARVDPARPRQCDGVHAGDRRHVPAQWLRACHGAVHPRRQPPGRDDTRIRRRSPRRIRRCSGCPPRTTATARTRSSSRTSRPARTTSPTSTRCGRLRPGSSWQPARSPTARWPIAVPRPLPSASARRPSSFPSDHGGFLGGEYGQAGDPDAFAAKLREVLAEG